MVVHRFLSTSKSKAKILNRKGHREQLQRAPEKFMREFLGALCVSAVKGT